MAYDHISKPKSKPVNTSRFQYWNLRITNPNSQLSFIFIFLQAFPTFIHFFCLVPRWSNHFIFLSCNTDFIPTSSKTEESLGEEGRILHQPQLPKEVSGLWKEAGSGEKTSFWPLWVRSSGIRMRGRSLPFTVVISILSQSLRCGPTGHCSCISFLDSLPSWVCIWLMWRDSHWVCLRTWPRLHRSHPSGQEAPHVSRLGYTRPDRSAVWSCSCLLMGRSLWVMYYMPR